MTAHTVDEALGRFSLIASTGSPDRNEACAMTLLAWVAGEAWTDHPRCTHPILANWAIRANDADGTTPDQRAQMVRAGETGILDTWWIPSEVVVWSWAQAPAGAGPVDRVLSVCQTITAWKADHRRVDLRGADLRGANLRGADLGGADLRSANLRGAYYTAWTVWPLGFDAAAAVARSKAGA